MIHPFHRVSLLLSLVVMHNIAQPFAARADDADKGLSQGFENYATGLDR